MKALFWHSLFVLLLFIVVVIVLLFALTVEAQEPCKCVYGDVPDTLWYYSIARIQVDRLRSDIPSLDFKLDTIWRREPVVLQPCPKNVGLIINPEVRYNEAGDSAFWNFQRDERQIIEDWMEWIAWKEGWAREELDRYLREKEK